MKDFRRNNPGFMLVFTIALCAAVITSVVTAIVAHTAPKPKPAALPVPRLFAFAAPGTNFCLGFNVRNVVQTDGGYENNLLGGSQRYPIADTDYLLPYGDQKHVCLPGTRYDHYYYRGEAYVYGSGWVTEWQTENGGRFAYLHQSYAAIQTAHPLTFHAPPSLTRGKPGPFTQEDADKHRDLSYARVPVTLPKLERVGNVAYHGGQYVGLSRWPDDPAYGFGTSGPYDAHLCVLYDSLAAEWFYRVANHLDHRAPPVKPFNWRLWNLYRTGHHLRVISPYIKGTHRFRTIALFWKHHMSLRGIRYGPKAYKGFHKAGFRYGVIYCWSNGKCKVARR